MKLPKLTPRARPLFTGVWVTSVQVLGPAQAVGVGVPCRGALPWPCAAPPLGGGAPTCEADTEATHTPPSRTMTKTKARIDFLMPLTVLLSFRTKVETT